MQILINHKVWGLTAYNNVRLIQKQPRVNFSKADIYIYVGTNVNNLEVHAFNSLELDGIDYISKVGNKIHNFKGA